MKNRIFCTLAAALFFGTSSFSQIQDGKYVFNHETCIIAYSANIFKDTDLADAQAVSNILLQQILNDWAVNLNSRVIIYENLEVMKKDIEDGKVDIFAVTTPEYFILRDQVETTPFLTYKLSDRTMERMLLISRNDSRIRSIFELKKRKIAVYSNLNDGYNLPNLWLNTRVLKIGGNYKEEYAPWIYKVRKGNNAISDVFFGKADAAVVPERDFDISKELNPQIGNQLSVIDSSKHMLYAVLCYTEKLTAALKPYKDCDMQSVSDMLCNAQKTDQGRQLLSIFRISGFIPLKNEYLTDTETLFNDFRLLSDQQERRMK
jgi:ABC-type phosphate/phosphonate transport system substrate-binding protein